MYLGFDLVNNKFITLGKECTLEKAIQVFVLRDLNSSLVTRRDKFEGYYTEYNSDWAYYTLTKKCVKTSTGYIYNTVTKVRDILYIFKELNNVALPSSTPTVAPSPPCDIHTINFPVDITSDELANYYQYNSIEDGEDLWWVKTKIALAKSIPTDSAITILNLYSSSFTEDNWKILVEKALYKKAFDIFVVLMESWLPKDRNMLWTLLTILQANFQAAFEYLINDNKITIKMWAQLEHMVCDTEQKTRLDSFWQNVYKKSSTSLFKED